MCVWAVMPCCMWLCTFVWACVLKGKRQREGVWERLGKWGKDSYQKPMPWRSVTGTDSLTLTCSLWEFTLSELKESWVWLRQVRGLIETLPRRKWMKFAISTPSTTSPGSCSLSNFLSLSLFVYVCASSLFFISSHLLFFSVHVSLSLAVRTRTQPLCLFFSVSLFLSHSSHHPAWKRLGRVFFKHALIHLSTHWLLLIEFQDWHFCMLLWRRVDTVQRRRLRWQKWRTRKRKLPAHCQAGRQV